MSALPSGIRCERRSQERSSKRQKQADSESCGKPVLTRGENIMVDRRTFMSLMAAAAATPGTAFAQPKARKAAKAGKVALYANVGEVLTRWDVDVDNCTLAPRESVTLPAGVQYAWPHKSRRYLYVATSSSASGSGPTGSEHHVTAFKIDPESGALAKHGESISLPVRPIHMTLDNASQH